MRDPLSSPLLRRDRILVLLATLALLVAAAVARAGDRDDVVDVSLAPARVAAPAGTEVAVFSGGCFWGVEGVFEHVRGVVDAQSGYTGGAASTAHYEMVGGGDTGHAESVKVTFDPKQVTYGQLLSVFFTVAHDPTQLDHQGPDYGSQYRSAVWYANPAQQRAAMAYLHALQAKAKPDAPIVTQVAPLQAFYPAEGYHQDFMRLNPLHPYILVHDRPKVQHLAEAFPKLYRDEGLAAR
jgi:peptide-methionine (S)-S-oxide reductase